jgi:hypothetical protein
MRLLATYRFGYAVAIVEIGFDCLCRYLQASRSPSAHRFRAGVVDSCQFVNCPTHRHKEVEF